MVVSSALGTGRLYPQEIHLVLFSVRGWVDPRAMYQIFGGKSCLHFHFYADALCSSETLIPTHQTKPYHNPQVHSSGNIKPHKLPCAWLIVIQRKCYTMFLLWGLLKVYDCRTCSAIVYHFLFHYVTSAVYSSLTVTSKSKMMIYVDLFYVWTSTSNKSVRYYTALTKYSLISRFINGYKKRSLLFL